MKNSIILYRLAAIMLFLIISNHTLMAQGDPPVIKTLSGSQIAVDSSVTVEDSKFYDPSYTGLFQTQYYPVKNFIIFKIKEDANVYFKSDFKAFIGLRVYNTFGNGTIDSGTVRYFDISYSAGNVYTNITSYPSEGAYRVKIKVIWDSTNVSWNVWDAISIENELQSFPDYVFDCSHDTINTVSHASLPSNTDADELSVSWPNIKVASEYDLEWTYVDDSALAAGTYGSDPDNPDPTLIFDNNASRVTITGTSYNIPLIYDDYGTLFFRVRAAQVKSDGSRFEGNWSSASSTGLGRFAYDGHQRNLNWQGTTSFAEEGKRKTVLQYYDGSLRSRQTVTKDNSTNTTIVAESFYDYQGRPVIQVLPAPTLNTIIKYTQNFNRGLNGAYDKSEFDTLPDVSQYCSTGAASMDTSSGASRYYSPNNPLKDSSFHRFIPDAEGYPFTETEYTQDNTGRISRQSGVGVAHKLGSGHETKYFYGTPGQKQLDALFGTEAGHFSHYTKNMVRDANGQYSVSYVDMHGRTVATALAGNVLPNGMDSLVSKNTRTMVDALSDPASVMIKDLVMESKKGLLVETAGPHMFTYQLNPDSIRIKGCDSTAVCYDCLYDLQITITGDCNNNGMPAHVAFDTTVANFKIDSIHTNCDSVKGFYFQFTKTLMEGSYEITKKLSVNRSAIDYYRDSVFMVKNSCKSLETFMNEQRTLLAAILQCKPTCQSCTDSLGTLSSFSARFKQQSGITEADTTYDSLIVKAYYTALDNCNELCKQSTEQDDIRKAMLLDMTAPSGQYANLDSLNDKYSIFYAQSKTEGNDTIADYRRMNNYYVDEFGTRDKVYDEEAGKEVYPWELSREAFMRKYKLSWAEALLPYHPEYCKLQEYEKDSLSHQWDRRFQATQTYADAMKKGYLNPTGDVSLPYSKYAGIDTADSDPYRTKYGNVLRDSLTKYRVVKDTNRTMWAIATATAKCTGKDTACLIKYLKNDSAFNSNMCAGDLDMAWLAFREFYLNTKHSLQSAHLDSVCTSPTTTTLLATGHQPHFGNFAEINAATHSNLPSGPGDLSVMEDSVQSFYAANCNAYVQMWIKQLAPCAYTQADLDSIMPRLVQVCIDGSDASHPMGASTSPDKGHPYTSFEQVIFEYNAAHGIGNPGACNAYVITTPRPYAQHVIYDEKPVWTKPDGCECAQITRLHNNYLAVSGSYASFSSYLDSLYHISMTDSVANLLLSLCDSSNSNNCTYLAKPIMLPAVMQCGAGDVCVDCDRINLLYAEFKTFYPSVKPVQSVTTSAELEKNQLFENFMNYKLGFTKSTAEYIAFMSLCGTSFTPESDTLDALVDSFYVKAKPGRIRHEFGTQDDPPIIYSDLHDLARYGVIYLPDSIRALPGDWYNNYQINTIDCPFKTDSGYTIAGRFKFLKNPGDGEIVVLGYRSLQATLQYYGSPFTSDDGPHPAGLYYVGSYLYAYDPGSLTEYVPAGGYKLIDANPDALLDWMTFKAQITPSHVYLYYKDSLIFDTTRNIAIPIGNHGNFSWHFRNRTGAIDWIRLGDVNDSTKYFEDFNNPDRPAVVDAALMNCELPSCETAFTDYFNSARGTSYSFSQIDSIYMAVSGHHPTACIIPPPPTDTCSLHPCPIRYGPTLCGRIEPAFVLSADAIPVDNCSDSTFFIVSKATDLYNVYRDSLSNRFDSSYRSKCMQAYKYESFTVSRAVSEYHYTLYYYDQAGNLVKTIPPAGVDETVYGRSTYFDSVTIARASGQTKVPAHTFATNYRYNTLNQVVSQQTPDAGISNFWYDRLGRLVISQNAKQKAASGTEAGRQYSYTLYDPLGRITEVGQVKNASPNPAMADSTSRNVDSLNTWLVNLTSNKEQVTRTYYDTAYSTVDIIPLNSVNLRNRVSWTTYTDGNSTTNFNQATFYSYDIHGNVDTLLQDYGSSLYTTSANIMNKNGSRWKKLVYKYDLISGKVNHVAFNPPYFDVTTRSMTNPTDAFYHRYSYDAENRLTRVETSMDSVLWETDARYEYYAHGPLARVVLGQQQVQGLDYAYTLQGWLKGMNSTSLYSGHDMGDDGISGSQHQFIAKDVLGFNLNYFTDTSSSGFKDYRPIDASVSPFANPAVLNTSNRMLFNGNISSMAVNNKIFNEPLLYNYKYDQLNRLIGQEAYTGLNDTTNAWSGLKHEDKYRERMRYDANGNIQHYDRYWTNTSMPMDSLNYTYIPGTNKLLHLKEANSFYSSVNGSSDIEDQPTNNYGYDEIGNLTRDSSANIRTGGIKWNVYGKVAEVNFTGGADGSVSRILYTYDAGGNRIGKKVTKVNSTRVDYTWYVRDAQGNVLQTYAASKDTSVSEPLGNFDLLVNESYIFGSNRLGQIQRNEYAEFNFGGAQKFGSRGQKFYDISNHLSNVLTTISDKKFGVQNPSDTNHVLYYNAAIITASDYYPFGMKTDRQYFGAAYGNRYGFNGKEMDKDVYGDGNLYDYGMRIYDSRVGRFLSVDLLTRKFAWFSPYQFSGNNPISNIDLDGGEPDDYKSKWMPKDLFVMANGQKIGSYMRIEDPQLGPIDVRMVYDNWNKKVWLVTDDDQGNNYYLKNDNGDHTTMNINPKTNELKGGHFEKFETQDRKQARYMNDLVNGTSTFFAGAVAAPFATQALISMSSTYVGRGIINAGIDVTSQLATNGGNFKDINLTSVATSFVFQNTSSWKGLFVKNVISNGLQVNSNLEYKGIGGDGISNTDILINIGLGTVFDKTVNGIQNLTKGYDKPALTRLKNLGYKPKYALELKQYYTKMKWSNFFNSVPGQIGTGILSNSISRDTKKPE